MSAIASILILVGSAFSVLAAVGVLRFPDLFTRLHAAAKVGPLGAGAILLGVAVVSNDLFVAVRCVLGLAFLVLSSPITAHLLARATRGSARSLSNIESIKDPNNSR